MSQVYRAPSSEAISTVWPSGANSTVASCIGPTLEGGAEQSAGPGVPEVDLAVAAPAGEEAAVGCVGQRTHLVVFVAVHGLPHPVAGLDVEDAHAVEEADGHALAVG